MLKNLRIKIFQKTLDRKIRQTVIERRPTDFDSANTVGIVFDATQSGNFDVVRDYAESLKRQGKKVDLLGYVDDKARHNDFVFKHFNQKDLNFWYQPRIALVQQFMNTPFDYLICLHTTESLPLEYVASLSKAQMRVGQYTPNKTHCYDLMIDTAQSKDLKNLVGQMDYFLKIINKKKHGQFV